MVRNEKYTRITGISSFRGGVSGAYIGAKQSVHKNFFKSEGARKRTAALVLSSALVLGYLFNKETLDERIDNVSQSYIEYREDLRARRDEKELLKLYNDANNKIANLNEELSSFKKSQDSLYAKLNEVSNQSINQSTNQSINQNTNQPTSRRTIRRPNRDSNTNINNTNNANNNQYWVAVPQGSSLSEIANKYLGSPSRYVELVQLNNLENPNLVLRNQPLRLPSHNIQTTEGTNLGAVPLYEQVLRRETLDQFLGRINLSASKQEIISYNQSKGNTLLTNDILLKNTDVVYLKNEWKK